MTEGPDDTRAHLDQLIVTLRRRQRVLETLRAGYGLAVLPHIVLELEDVARDLAKAQAELRRLRPAAPADREPYRGLLTFRESDAEHFFGRDALVADLVERAGRAPFLAVLGASGSGKSSVVRAGLIPMLKGGALPGSERWRYVTFKPGPQPLEELATRLATLHGGDLGSKLALVGQLAQGDRALLRAARLILDGSQDERLALVVDQAEELWTQAQPEQRDRFINLLLVAAEAPAAPVLTVLTMRADFLHRALERRALAERIERSVAFVGLMTPDELREAIVRPAEAAGGFEPGLADELIAQALDRPGALPLLEYTLQELWRQRAPDGTMTWAALQALGGVEGGLARKADSILQAQYIPERREDLRAVLLRLVQPGEGAADTRRRVRLDDLATEGQPIEAVQTLLAPLVDARLLVITTADDGRPCARAGDGGRWSVVSRRTGARGADPFLAGPGRMGRRGARRPGAADQAGGGRASGRPAVRTPTSCGPGCRSQTPRRGWRAPGRGSPRASGVSWRRATSARRSASPPRRPPAASARRCWRPARTPSSRPGRKPRPVPPPSAAARRGCGSSWRWAACCCWLRLEQRSMRCSKPAFRAHRPRQARRSLS